MLNSSVLHRELTTPDLASAAGDASIYDSKTKQYVIDLSSGAGITCLGYNAQKIKASIASHANTLPYVHASNWTTNSIEQFGELLLKTTNEIEDAENQKFMNGGSLFLNSGAEAVEAACKLACQYFRESGNNKTPVIFARENSYHGNTFFTLELGDHPRKKNYTGVLTETSIKRFASFRPSWDKAESWGTYISNSLKSLEMDLIHCTDNDIPAIVVIEPIGGTTLGIEPGTSEYLLMLRKLCDHYNAILIYDEVLSGNFRTGHLFAWQYYSQFSKYSVAPDIIATGKGLTGGYFPLSAVIVSEKIRTTITDNSHKIWHSTTNQNHPIGCAAALSAFSIYKKRYSDIDRIGKHISEVSVPKLMACKHIQSVQGVHTLCGIRLNQFAPGLHRTIRAHALLSGVAVYSEGQTVNNSGNFLLFAPPYCITNGELDTAINKLIRSIDTICAG